MYDIDRNQEDNLAVSVHPCPRPTHYKGIKILAGCEWLDSVRRDQSECVWRPRISWMDDDLVEK